MKNKTTPPQLHAKNFSGMTFKLIVYMKSWLPMIFVSLCCAVVAAILTVMGPNKLSELAAIIMAGIATQIDIVAVQEIIIILFSFYLTSFVLHVLQNILMATIASRASQKMRDDISHKINRLPMWFYDKTSNGDILSRVTNDVDTLGQNFNQSIGNLVASVTLFLGTTIMMFVTNWILALVAIGTSLFGFLFMRIVMSRSQKYFLMQQKHLGEINGHIEEEYSGHSVMKVYNAEKQEKEKFDVANIALRRSAFKAQCLSGMMSPFMDFIANFAYVAVCVVGAVLTQNAIIGFPTIIAFMVYVNLFTKPLSNIAQAMQSLQSAAAAGERVFEFLEAEEMENENHKAKLLPEKIKGDVDFEHVQFTYKVSGIKAMHDFTTHAKAGQKIAIVGPTGAGKTTIVNLLMRFDEVNSGTIKIDGIPTTEMTREEVRSQFCMVLQDTWLFEGTIRENLVYNLNDVPDEKIVTACKAVGIDHFIESLPQKYETVLHDNLNLSAGQKQQLTIARAMIADKPILILDEATSSIDTRTELKIQAAMDELMKNRTSFVIAHRLSTIKNADNILVLNHGDIVEQGTHKDLLAKKGFYANLYNSQFEHAL